MSDEKLNDAYSKTSSSSGSKPFRRVPKSDGLRGGTLGNYCRNIHPREGVSYLGELREKMQS